MKIDFEVQTEHGMYRDALYFTDEEYAALTEDDIEQLKQTRVDNWIAVITAPPVEVVEEEVQPAEEDPQVVVEEDQEPTTNEEQPLE